MGKIYAKLISIRTTVRINSFKTDCGAFRFGHTDVRTVVSKLVSLYYSALLPTLVHGLLTVARPGIGPMPSLRILKQS
jgi:hypothetical protein